MAVTLFAQTYAPYLALGVGELGGHAAAAGCLTGFGERVPWAACDTQPARLLATGLERKLLIELPEQARAEAAVHAVAAHAAELSALAEGRSLAIIFGALGEPVAGLLLPALSIALRETGVPVWALGVEPFPLEGPESAASAGRAAARLVRSADLFICLPSRALLAPLGAGCSLSSAYQAAADALLNAVQAALGACVGLGAPGPFTPRKVTQTMRGGSPVMASAGSGHGPDGPRVALEDALDARWQPNGASVQAQRLAVALTAGRELSVAEMEAIRARLQREHPAAAAALLGLGVESSLGDEVRCLVMRRPAPSPNVIPLAARE